MTSKFENHTKAVFSEHLNNLAGYARKDVHAHKIGKRYEPIKGPITHDELERHYSGEAVFGVYVFPGVKTQCAILDFDDHDGSAGWDKIKAAAIKIRNECRARGLPCIAYRSQGGKRASTFGLSGTFHNWLSG